MYVHEEFGSVPKGVFEIIFFFFQELEFQISHIKIRKPLSNKYRQNIGCGATYHSRRE